MAAKPWRRSPRGPGTGVDTGCRPAGKAQRPAAPPERRFGMRVKTSRSLDALIGEQLAKWHQQKAELKKKAARPGFCITISREPGSGGSDVARRLAADLGMDLIGAQLIQKIAEQAGTSEKVIASLDEREVRLRDSWLDALFRKRHITPDEYLRHLTQVVGTIGKQGNTVIVGRGAQFILPPPENFRVRIIAPRESRIRNVMRDAKVDFEAAEQYVYETEANRDAFHRKYFHDDWANPDHYDLVVNTGSLGIEGAVAGIEAAFAVWNKLPHEFA
jgi:cytidylate kinase